MVCFRISSEKQNNLEGLLGNGTQSIVWQINEETHRQTLENKGKELGSKAGLKIFYGSIHDILSYPCEVLYFSFQLSSFYITFRMGKWN